LAAYLTLALALFGATMPGCSTRTGSSDNFGKPRLRPIVNGTKILRDAFRFMVAWSARERRGFRNDELAVLIRQATGVEPPR
jgi:hypothetical protein